MSDEPANYGKYRPRHIQPTDTKFTAPWALDYSAQHEPKKIENWQDAASGQSPGLAAPVDSLHLDYRSE